MKKYPKKPLLVDCDGVLSGFIERTLEIAKDANPNFNLMTEDIEKDTRQYPYWTESNLDKIAYEPGFCESLKPLPGAQDFIEKVRKQDIQVICLTSPMKNNKHWHWERQEWLLKHYEIKRTELIFATDKRYVNGFCFLDDHVGNILDWQEYQGLPAVLIKRPWNNDVLKDCIQDKEKQSVLWHNRNQALFRTNDWEEIYNFVIMRNQHLNK